VEAERRIANRFLTLHPEDAARLCEGLQPADVAAFFGEISAAMALPVLQRLTPAVAADFLPLLPEGRGAGLLAQLPPESAAGILRRMSEEERAAMLASMPEKAASTFSLVLRYSAHTAGALMDPTVLSLPSDIHANEARQLTRRSARRLLYYLYVVDRDQKLVGVVSLRELILADPHEALASIMHTPVVHLPGRADTAAVLAHPGWRTWHALPVVDEHGLLLGAVRYDTFRRLEEEVAPHVKFQEALGVAIGLGELYWVVAAQLLGSLGPSASPESRSPVRRESNGTQPESHD
jgi:magnesium transporter